MLSVEGLCLVNPISKYFYRYRRYEYVMHFLFFVFYKYLQEHKFYLSTSTTFIFHLRFWRILKKTRIQKYFKPEVSSFPWLVTSRFRKIRICMRTM